MTFICSLCLSVCVVRDFSKAQVSLQPAEFASWNEARAELMIEKKRPLKMQLAAETTAAETEEAVAELQKRFASREKALEHDLDHRPMEVHLELGVSYNFLS